MHPSITLSNIRWTTPDGRDVLSGIDAAFTSERCGIVGRNGSGKSTLLNIVAGTLPPSGGNRVVHGTVAMLNQSVDISAGRTVAELFGVGKAMADLERALRGEADAQVLAAIDWTLESRIADALADVALHCPATTPLEQLSGGQRTRAALAAALFACPDFLLLDEPTNNLDREGRDALLRLIRRWRSGAIIVSHDRELLDEMDAIVELSPHGAARYGGNGSAYAARRKAERTAAEEALSHARHQADQVARKAQQATERQQRRDAAGRRSERRGDMPRILLGARKERAENSGGEGRLIAERQRRAATEQVEAAREKIEVIDPLTVRLPSSNLPSDRRVLDVEALRFAYDSAPALFDDLSFSLNGPERVAICGPNGSGKSTLLQLIVGALRPQAGRITCHVPHALLDQQAMLLDEGLSIIDNLRARHRMIDRNAAHAALARMGFRADAALQRVSTLSGGQRLRAALACVLGGGEAPQLLILDEPTNHLDLDSIAAVEEGLQHYDGALLIVSHDRRFLDAIGIERHITLAAD